MYSGIMSLANGGDPDKPSRLRQWQERKRAGSRSNLPPSGERTLNKILQEKSRNVNMQDRIKYLVQQIAKGHATGDGTPRIREVFNTEVPGYPSITDGRRNKTIAELLGFDPRGKQFSNVAGSQAGVNIQNAYLEALEKEVGALGQRRMTRETKRVRQAGRGPTSGSKFLVDDAAAREAVKQFDERSRVNRTSAGPGSPGVGRPVNRTSAGPGMPRKSFEEWLRGMSKTDLDNGVLTKAELRETYNREVPVNRTSAGPGSPGVEPGGTPPKLRKYVLANGQVTKKITLADAKELDKLGLLKKTGKPGATLPVKKNFQRKFVSPGFNPVTGEFDKTSKLPPGGQRLQSQPYTPNPDPEHAPRRASVKDKIKVPTKINITQEFNAYNSEQQNKILKTLEKELTDPLRKEARITLRNGGQNTSGHSAPAYIFNSKTVPVDEVPVATKIKDWVKFLQNRGGRGNITGAVVKNIMKTAGKAGALALGTVLFPPTAIGVAAQNVALWPTDLGDGSTPESFYPDWEEKQQEEQQAMASYTKDLMGSGFDLASDPNIDFDRFFEDKPEPGTPMLDVLGIR